MNTEQIIDGLGVTGVIALGLLFFITALLWLFLPFVLISKLNTVIKRLSAIESSVEATARPYPTAGNKGVH